MMAADVSAVSLSINKPAPGWFLARDTLLEGTSEIVCLSERDCARAQEWQHVETSDRWRGGLAHGLPSGDGVYVFANSRLQVRGSVHGDAEHLVFSGHGVMIWPDGARYDGELRESKFDGRGIFSWANGDCYEGAWREGQRHGTGTLVSRQTSLLDVAAVEIGKYANEMRYCGEWENDLMHGQGVIEYFEAPEGVCQDGDQAPPHGKLLRRFEGLFKKGFPTSGSLQTRTEYFEQVHFDGATHAGDFATWYWTGSATGEERGTSLVDLACVGEEYRAASSRFSKSLPGLHIASIQRVQNDDRRVIYDLQRRALEKKVTAPPRSRVWNIRTMERWAFHAPVLPFLPLFPRLYFFSPFPPTLSIKHGLSSVLVRNGAVAPVACGDHAACSKNAGARSSAECCHPSPRSTLGKHRRGGLSGYSGRQRQRQGVRSRRLLCNRRRVGAQIRIEQRVPRAIRPECGLWHG